MLVQDSYARKEFVHRTPHVNDDDRGEGEKKIEYKPPGTYLRNRSIVTKKSTLVINYPQCSMVYAKHLRLCATPSRYGYLSIVFRRTCKPITFSRRNSSQTEDYKISQKLQSGKSISDILEELKGNVATPSINIYNTVLKSLSSDNSDPMLVVTTYKDMVQNGIEPDYSSYYIIIAALLDSVEYKIKLMSDPVLLTGVEKRHGRSLVSVSNVLKENIELDAKLTAERSCEIFERGEKLIDPKLWSRLMDICVRLKLVPQLTTLIELQNSPSVNLTDISNLVMAYEIIGKPNIATTKLIEYRELLLNPIDTESFESICKIYSATIGAYFNSSRRLEAMTTFEKLLSDGIDTTCPAFERVVLAMVIGLVKCGDLSAAWRYITMTESNPAFNVLSVSSLARLFSEACNNGDHKFVHNLFDYIASRKDCCENLVFNQVRSDYIMFCINSADGEGFQKALKEARLRDGIWDHCTLVQVVKYLVTNDYSGLALDTLQTQVFRLSIYIEKTSNQSLYHKINHEVISELISFLKSSGVLNSEFVLHLGNPRFISQYSDKLVSKILRNLPKADDELLPDMLFKLTNFYSFIIQHGERKKKMYTQCVNQIINRDLYVSSTLFYSVNECLQLLNLNKLQEKWEKTITVSEPIPFFNDPASGVREIEGYCATQDGGYKALERFEDCLKRKKNVTAEDVIALVELGDKYIIQKVYELSNSYFPDGYQSVRSWESWIGIYRSLLSYSEDWQILNDTYKRLKSIGSFPNSLGYANLIQYKASAEEVLDLYQEAKTNGVTIAPLMLCTLLKKLHKEKQYGEAKRCYYENDLKTPEIYSTIIKVSIATGDKELAETLVDDMEKVIEVPPVSIYNNLMDYYVHVEKDKYQALNYYHRILDFYPMIQPSSRTYKLLIEMYTALPPIDINSADKVLKVIAKNGGKITTEHYALLIAARGIKSNNPDEARAFYNALVFRGRVKPDSLIFQALIESYVFNGKVEETTKILEEMKKYGVEINLAIGNALIRGWGSINFDKFQSLFYYLVNNGISDSSLYKTASQVYLNNGKSHTAKDISQLI